MATKNDMDMIRFDSIRFDSIEVIQYEQHGMAHSCATQQACNVSQSQLRDFNFVKEWTMCWSEMKQSTHTTKHETPTHTHSYAIEKHTLTQRTHIQTKKLFNILKERKEKKQTKQNKQTNNTKQKIIHTTQKQSKSDQI